MRLYINNQTLTNKEIKLAAEPSDDGTRKITEEEIQSLDRKYQLICRGYLHTLSEITNEFLRNSYKDRLKSDVDLELLYENFRILHEYQRAHRYNIDKFTSFNTYSTSGVFTISSIDKTSLPTPSGVLPITKVQYGESEESVFYIFTTHFNGDIFCNIEITGQKPMKQIYFLRGNKLHLERGWYGNTEKFKAMD